MTIHPERWQAFLGKANEGETELATDDGPLTYRKVERVLKRSSWAFRRPRQPGRAGSASAVRAGRGVVQGAGRMPELPFDPTHDEEESPVKMAADDPFDNSSTWGSYDHASGLGRT